MVSASGVEDKSAIVSAPNNHFRSGPDSRVTGSCDRGAFGAGGPPSVSRWIVSPAAVEVGPAAVVTTPYNHFPAGPDHRVNEAGAGGIGQAHGLPGIHDGIVPAPAATVGISA